MGATGATRAMAVLVWTILLFAASAAAAASDTGGTIGFSSLGRLSFDFDAYTLALPTKTSALLLDDDDVWALQETRVTLGESLNYNAQLVEAQWGSAVAEKLIARHGLNALLKNVKSATIEVILYVSELEGSPQLYLDIPITPNELTGGPRKRPIAVREADLKVAAAPKAFLNDKPSMNGDRIIFVSTEEDIGIRAQGWNAVFSLDFKTSVTKRLTPPGVTDYSPAVSPSGEWVAAASNQGRGWLREMEALNLDLYVFKAEDGSQRRMVVKNAGWPAWADESTVYFHRIAEDGWWSIFKVNVSDTSATQEAERVTPPGVHAFTPAASRNGKWIAVATRRATSFRHIEIFDLKTKTFIPITARIHPNTNHYSPFISPNSNKLGYHRCRGVDEDAAAKAVNPRMEYQVSPLAGVSLFRIAGIFPVMSPDGSSFSFVQSGNDSADLGVMNLDGSQKRTVSQGHLFATSWDPTGTGTVYASKGPIFRSVTTPVQIVAIRDAESARFSDKFLTKGKWNNAFPSPSPDGKYLVFRSSRGGYKNLYVMPADGGEDESSWRQLTEGPWRDTGPVWSPDNQWIVFSSNRLHPTGERSFSLYLIRPNGTDLHILLDMGVGGLAMHPAWSPDGRRLVFTSNYAGVSAEPIAFPHNYIPAGSIYVINVDGSGLTRLTHNPYEDGTPSWGRRALAKADVSTDGEPSTCAFDDVWFVSPSPSVRSVHSGGLCHQRWEDNLSSSVNQPILQM